MNFQDLKISTRLALAFGALVLLTAVVGGINVYNAWGMQTNLRDTVERRMLLLRDLGELRDAHNLETASMRSALLSTSSDVMDEQLEIIAESRQNVQRLFTGLDPLVNSDTGRPLFDKMLATHRAYLHEVDRMINAMRDSSLYQDPLMMLDTEVRPHQESYFNDLKALTHIENELTQASSQDTLQASNRIIYVALGAVVAIVLASVLLSLALIRVITRPIHTAVEIARAVADGDLTVRIQAHGKNEAAQLLQALEDMQAGLLKVVSTVRSGSDALAMSSAEIARGNQDLSSRTESQASALQETAAAMNVLGGTVTKNADNAAQANQLAQSASHVAAQGGEVVSEVVSTMQGISESSKRIGEIISVIDGIAFQTNILALNAAVEAARAGEQGRGFAVVANEVRSLAHRSAEAAKEIKQLIMDSVQRIETGSQLVDRAGHTMQNVVSSIQRVTDIVGEISAASQEQSSGVNQVSQAVTLMDQSTQQNAALVEEMAASALSLNGQAKELVQAVAAFRIDAKATRSSRTTAKAKSATQDAECQQAQPLVLSQAG